MKRISFPNPLYLVSAFAVLFMLGFSGFAQDGKPDPDPDPEPCYDAVTEWNIYPVTSNQNLSNSSIIEVQSGRMECPFIPTDLCQCQCYIKLKFDHSSQSNPFYGSIVNEVVALQNGNPIVMQPTEYEWLSQHQTLLIYLGGNSAGYLNQNTNFTIQFENTLPMNVTVSDGIGLCISENVDRPDNYAEFRNIILNHLGINTWDPVLGNQ